MATQAIVREAVGTMAEEQAQTLDPQQPCPTCGKLCELQRKSRDVAVRGGTTELARAGGPLLDLPSRFFSLCVRVLRIDGHAYSSTILHRILHMAAVSSSFDQAEVSLASGGGTGDFRPSDQQLGERDGEPVGDPAGRADRAVRQPTATAPRHGADDAARLGSGVHGWRPHADARAGLWPWESTRRVGVRRKMRPFIA